MGVLVTLRQMSMNGELIQPNEKIRVENEQPLINKGYARRLTEDESRAIVSEYVSYAEKVFNEKPVVFTSKKDKKRAKKTWEMKGLFEDE